ncbi:MAG TPA: MBL fold metallo-hydrolase [Abditibacteriaceae bacterium]|nr:MBL fold metallo-hydrolase [Abditibacteriaceae bacterium]
MKLTFLGTGTSYGVPYVGCECAVCQSDDPRNQRLRCSILIEGNAGDDEAASTQLLVDTTPDLRQQFLRAGVKRISAVLWTHSHNDHIIGLDDVRPLCDRVGYIDGYADAGTMAQLKRIFSYIFVPGRDHGGFPRMTDHVLEPAQTVLLGDICVTAIPIYHGQREIFAYKFQTGERSVVYATDCSGIPETSWELLHNADLLVLDALRHRPHPTHFSLEQALEATTRLQPQRAYFTHIAHDLDHAATNATLPAGVELAYDTLSIEL